MTVGARLAESELSVLLDVRHPLAYLALHPTIALVESLGIRVNWLPLTTPTLRPPSEPQDSDDRGIRHRRFRAEAIAREVETYAEAQGLVIREWYREPDPSAANLGWLWVRERDPDQIRAYLVELFRSYWAASRDLSDLAETAALVDAVKSNGAAFTEWARGEGPTRAAALAGELRDAGLFQVPAFVVDDEVFYGRQHLPMIRWMLEERTGTF